MNLLFIDCETTGVDPKIHSVIQIAAIHYFNGAKGEHFNRKLKPIKASLNISSIQTHKIPYDKLLSFEDPYSVFKDFLAYILRIPQDKDNPLYVVGHNVNFDINFLKQFFADFSVEGWEKVFKITPLDTAAQAVLLQDAGIIDKFRINLFDLAKNLGVEVDSAKMHDALEDTRITAECYFKMQDRLKNLLNQANK